MLYSHVVTPTKNKESLAEIPSFFIIKQDLNLRASFREASPKGRRRSGGASGGGSDNEQERQTCHSDRVVADFVSFAMTFDYYMKSSLAYAVAPPFRKKLRTATCSNTNTLGILPVSSAFCGII